jgi:hypothetical protein
VTKSFAVPLDEKVLYATLDNPENHHYDRMGMRSFTFREAARLRN